MKITDMKLGHVPSPLGFELDHAAFSWIVEDTASSAQTAARVEIAADAAFATVLFDSGKRADISGLSYRPDFAVQPRTRYFWRVTVWGDAGDMAVSETAWFETGKLDESWEAQWITPDWEDKSLHPYLRRAFTLPGKAVCARVYATGLGLYTVEMNGKKAGCEYLTPDCNAYRQWIQYQTYDVTDLLAEGENVIGAMLGNGWAKGRFGFSGESDPSFVDRFGFLCELRVTLADGSTYVLGTDLSWKAAPGPVLDSSIYDGETFDANLIRRGWSAPGHDDAGWAAVRPFDPAQYRLGALSARMSLPVVVKHVLRPAALLRTPKGETVLDIGQNMTGWLRFKADVPKGTKLSLYHGEILQDDCFYNENLRSAKAEYHYISDGNPAVCEPLFTFYGFRFVKLQGWPTEPSLDDFEACVVYSDLEEIGSIETSSDKLNRLFLNALWGQRGNFLDVPTDCPQRDERMGWTGDAQVFCGTASFNMDSYAFYAKFLRDMYTEQLVRDGSVPHVVPVIAPEGKEGMIASGGACAWADAATVIPWEVYLHTGDKSILERQFDSMRAWVDWADRQGAEVGGRDGWLRNFHFGDWLALDGKDINSVKGGTEDYYLAAAYFVYSTRLVAKAAKVLGKADLYEKYHAISEKAKAALQNEYFTGTGRLCLTNQTAYVVALYMDLAKKEHRPKVLEELRKRLAENDMHLKTGFIGTPYLCRVLSEGDADEDAYKLLFNEDFPSWLYEVNMGATTIWERWNSVNPDGRISSTGMNSLNHYSYGSIVEWMYRHMCGINPCEDAPGFRRAVIRPVPNGGLRYAKATVRTAMGRYASGWELHPDGMLAFDVVVPFGAAAELLLPEARLEKVRGTEGLAARQAGNKVSVELKAGTYRFEYMPEKDYLPHYDLDTPVSELVANAAAKAVLVRYFPIMNEGDMVLDQIKDATLNMLRGNAMAADYFGSPDWEALAAELSAIGTEG